jgi:hypothetical protein
MGTMIDSSGHNAIVSEHRPGTSSPRIRASAVSLVATVALLALLLPGRPVRAEFDSFGPFLPLQVSTVPSNGDLNPYGLAFVPADFPFGGDLKPGQMLISTDPMVSQDPNEPSEIVEFTRSGRFVRQYSVDPNLGSAFALGIANHDDAKVFAYVDDFLSTCPILNLAAGMS